MKIGIDIDGTISERPEFFSFLTHAAKGVHDVYIITARREEDREETIEELDEWNIHHDHLILTDQKAGYINRIKLDVYFDDDAKMIKGIKRTTFVLQAPDIFGPL